MEILREELIRRARDGKREAKNLDFKVGFDTGSREAWCEIVKDIVAFANSGGGALVFGAHDDGTPADVDVSLILSVDPADVTNKVNAYTGYEFDEFEIIEIERGGRRLALYAVFGVATPMVFIRDGAHLGQGKSRRPAFVKGSVYFRHGAKSAPGTSNDLSSWLERSLESIRSTWLDGIRKVVEAGADDVIHVVSAEKAHAAEITARIGNEPGAPVVRPLNSEDVWPYRETELVRCVLRLIPNGIRFNGHDVRSVRQVHGIDPRSHPEFVFKPHEMSSPQYSEAFAEWIAEQYRLNRGFLNDARKAYREMLRGRHLAVR